MFMNAIHISLRDIYDFKVYKIIYDGGQWQYQDILRDDVICNMDCYIIFLRYVILFVIFEYLSIIYINYITIIYKYKPNIYTLNL